MSASDSLQIPIQSLISIQKYKTLHTLRQQTCQRAYWSPKTDVQRLQTTSVVTVWHFSRSVGVSMKKSVVGSVWVFIGVH